MLFETYNFGHKSHSIRWSGSVITTYITIIYEIRHSFNSKNKDIISEKYIKNWYKNHYKETSVRFRGDKSDDCRF